MVAQKWTRERRRALTRTALIDAAGEVFARRGFHGASLDQIAETAGFTRGAIYKHFEGKEDLLLAVYDRCNELVLQAFADQFSQGRLAPLDAHALALAWHDLIANNTELFALELEFRLYELRNPSVQQRSAAQRRRNRDVVAQFLRDQTRTSGILLKVDPDTLAGILLATSDGFVAAAHADPQDAKRLYESFLELFLPALINTDPTTTSEPDHRGPTGTPSTT